MADLIQGGIPTAEVAPSSRRRAVLGAAGLLPLVLLIGLAVTQNFDVAAFGVLAPQIKHTFHLDNAGIDAITSLTAAVPVMCSIFLGYFGDKGNRLHLTAVGAVLWGIAAIFTGLAPVLAVLVAARLAGGVGLLASQTIYPSLLSDYYPPEGLSQIFTVFLIGSTGLGLVGSPLAGWLGSVTGWRPTFVVLALPTFLCAALILTFLREPARRTVTPGAPPGADVQVMAATPFAGSIRDGFRAVRAIRTLRRVWMSAFLFGAGTIPLATVVSVYFHDVYHLGSTQRGAIAALIGLFGLGGIIAGGTLMQRIIGRGEMVRFPIVSGLFVVEFGIFAIVMALTPDLAGSIVAACILSVGAIGFLPIYVTGVAVITPPSLRSQAYAWSLFFYALGAICISGLIGAVADARGQRVALGFLGVLVVVGGLIAVSARRFVHGDLERLQATD
ncbi:MAG TPA: MFS transporter [Acidimicrobiales bacterium]|nr:MFS transporter [Acidimicrobiales bacterium]